jgi:hypothetical protein
MKPARNYNLDYLDELSGGDESFKMEMIRHFIGNSPKVLDNLSFFLAEKEWKRFRDEIHKFTPNLSMMGIIEIIPVANELERLSEKVIELERIPDLYNGFEQHVRLSLSDLVADYNY